MASGNPQQQRQGLRAQQVQRNRRSILDAARRQLIEAGYHRLSMEAIATAAEVTRVTIYRQFDSKLGLLDALAENLNQQAHLVSGLQRAAARGTTDAFHAMVAELCRFWSTDPDLFRRLISLAAVDPEARQVIETRERWRYDQVSRFVQRLANENRLHAPFDAQQASATAAAVTSFPTCDEIATRLDCTIDKIDTMLIALLASVVHLD